MLDPAYPFIDDFLSAKKGTVYALSDAQVRVRDAHAILALVRFFAEHGVDVDLRTVLAAHTRTFDAGDLSLLFRDRAAEQEAQRILTSDGPLTDRIRELFKKADAIRRERIARPGSSAGAGAAEQLVARGPVLLLGRPSEFPRALLAAIESELESVGRFSELETRFELVSEDPYADPRRYRTIRDRYALRYLPPLLFPVEDAAYAPHSDHAILRIVRGRFPHRSFVFAYGPGSLGTLAAAQTLVDRELNAELVSLGIVEFLGRYLFAEVLLEASQFVDPKQPWRGEFAPSTITPCLRPIPPPPQTATAFLTWLDAGERGPAEFEGVYRRRPADGHIPCPTFECLPSLPEVSPDGTAARVWRLVGGPKIRQVVAQLIEAAEKPTKTPVLLIGETGVGKEIAARIIYEEITLRLLRSLGEGKMPPPPVLPGPRFVAVNCAALTETLAASELFGIGAGVGTEVAPYRGPMLNAGEGVVLLDEIESMRPTDQATLLRTLDPPHVVTPVGTSARVPVSALVVAATNVEPDQLILSNRMRRDLYGRFQARMIRIPPLRDRREDIPALLAYLSGGDVLIARTALTALMLHDHPWNVRGLVAVIERARRRQSSPPLRILGEDLDGTVAALAGDLYGRQAAAVDTEFVRFKSDSTETSLGRIFESAAEVLATFRPGEKGGDETPISRRARVSRFDEVWEPGQPGGGKRKKESRDRVLETAPAGEGDPGREFVNRWLELVEAAALHHPARGRSEALLVLGRLFALAWPEVNSRCAVIRLIGTEARLRKRLREKDVATSVGQIPSGFSQLLPPKGAKR